MKKVLNVLILLTVAFTMVAVSTPGHAVTNKVILQIEGMT